LCILFILIGFSRNYLGVHTPQDVIVGLLEGLLVLLIVVKMKDKIHNHGLWSCVLVALTIFSLVKSYPLYEASDADLMKADALLAYGLGFGYLLGTYLESKYLNFDCMINTKTKVIRFVIGTLITAITFFGLNTLLKMIMARYLAKLFVGFITTLVALYVCPLIFMKIEKNHPKDDLVNNS